MPVITQTPISSGRFTPLAQNMSNSPWRRHVFECAIGVVNTDTFVALPQALPANHVLVSAEMNWATAVGLATAVKVGLGISGDPDSVLLSAATLTKNTKTFGHSLTTKSNQAATTYRVSCVDTNGAAAGTFNATATIWVRMVFDVIAPWHDAA